MSVLSAKGNTLILLTAVTQSEKLVATNLSQAGGE